MEYLTAQEKICIKQDKFQLTKESRGAKYSSLNMGVK